MQTEQSDQEGPRIDDLPHGFPAMWMNRAIKNPQRICHSLPSFVLFKVICTIKHVPVVWKLVPNIQILGRIFSHDLFKT
jgi:hypothetical protein